MYDSFFKKPKNTAWISKSDVIYMLQLAKCTLWHVYVVDIHGMYTNEE